MTTPSRASLLADNRILGYDEYGPSDGRPLLIFHGNPGSRRDAALVDTELFTQHGVHAIVPDRPGIGLSTFQPGRRLLDWPSDVSALLAALGIERCAVMGISAGGAYALAWAYALPKRVTQGLLVSTVTPYIAEGEGQAQRYFALARRSWWLVAGILVLMRRGLQDPAALVAQAQASMAEADRQALQEPHGREAFLATLRAGFRQGVRGLAWDAMLVARPWGFRVADVQTPFRVWHGEADENAPVAQTRALAGELKHGELRTYPGEGHFSLAIRHFDEFLALTR
jgi:pimeloyl-ACP methyl ester carboxylesterase